MSKKKNNHNGFVYSTDPHFNWDADDSDEKESVPPEKQKIQVRLETKHRAGKAVTAILGFQGTIEEEEQLVRQLKNHCGTGGSSKDGELIIQGDQRERVVQWLQKNGFALAKRIG
jgi:translation initiation factor 1